MLEEQKELVQYRLESAKDRAKVAKLLLDTENYKDAISKSYYAMFTAVRAIMASRGVDFSRHSGVIAYFQKEYIKTGIFDKKYSKYLTKAFQIRNSSDYDDFYIVSKEDVEVQYDRMMELMVEIVIHLRALRQITLEKLFDGFVVFSCFKWESTAKANGICVYDKSPATNASHRDG